MTTSRQQSTMAFYDITTMAMLAGDHYTGTYQDKVLIGHTSA